MQTALDAAISRAGRQCTCSRASRRNTLRTTRRYGCSTDLCSSRCSTPTSPRRRAAPPTATATSSRRARPATGAVGTTASPTGSTAPGRGSCRGPAGIVGRGRGPAAGVRRLGLDRAAAVGAAEPVAARHRHHRELQQPVRGEAERGALDCENRGRGRNRRSLLHHEQGDRRRRSRADPADRIRHQGAARSLRFRQAPPRGLGRRQRPSSTG